MSTSAGRVLLMPKGEYNAATTYTMLDMVRYGKSTFVCKKTTTGNAPSTDGDTEYWQLITTSGDVSGVKGNAEETYREGNVNLTPANLGIYPFSSSTLSIGGLVPPAQIGDEGKFLMGDGSWDDSAMQYLTTAVEKVKTLMLTVSSVSALPQTVNNLAIESDMVAIKAEYSNAAAYVDATVTTTTGSLTISGTISGTTDITLYLMKSRS